MLADEARRLGASIRIGFTAKAIDEQTDGAKVTFTNGEEGLYDLIVGADGIARAPRHAVRTP